MLRNVFLKLQFKKYWLLSKIFKFMTIHARRADFKLITSTENEVHRVVTFNEKEPETIKWIDDFQSKMNGNDEFVLFDVGANVGIYSLYTAACYPKAKIFSFEPDSQSFGSLCKNIFINRFSVHPYQFAISANQGIGVVRLSSMNAGAGACALGSDYQFTDTIGSEVFEQGVFFCSLDDLVTKYGFPTPNFIKIDVDGIESIILEGAETVLRSNDCKGVLVEFQYRSDSDLDLMKNHMLSLGFSLISISDWEAEFKDLRSRNFIFSKKS